MKLGLVLAGGGGKGGYEIGVWKYLKEVGLDKKIEVISGTSVGGLNAALMGTVEYSVAEHIWTSEIADKILDDISGSHKNGALFSRVGLIEIIDKYVDLSKLNQSDVHVYTTCYNTDGFIAEYFNLNKYKVEDMKKMLCATSAIPVAFQNETIFGRTYVDGGLKDNVPLSPLLDEKCTHALIVNLSDEHVDYSGFNIKTVVLHPSSNLGNLFSGTMDFSLENSKKRIELGYDDCKKIYSLKILSLLEENNMNDEEMRKAEEINGMNNNQILLETLKKISENPSLVGKISCNMNWELETAGGKIWWKLIAEFGGWKFQQNNVFKQVRLLDPMNNRKAWGDAQKMVDICKNFLMTELKNEIDAKHRYQGKQTAKITDENSIEVRLAKLKALYDQSYISELDYENRKQEILKEI